MATWVLIYDDGRTPAIYAMEVEAETISDALAASGLRAPDVTACVLLTTVGRRAAAK